MVFDRVIPNADHSQLLQITLALVAGALAAALFQFTRGIAIIRVEGKLGASLQAAVWDRLLSLPVPFFREYSAGDLADRAMGIDGIRQVLSGATILSILAAVFSVFNFALLFFFDPRLAWAATGLVLVVIVVTTLAGYLKMRHQRQLTQLQGRISGLILQFITGISKLRVAGAEGRAFAFWAREFSAQRKLAHDTRTIANVLAVFNAAYPILTLMVIFAMIAAMGKSRLSTGSFLAFNAAFSQFLLAGLQVSSVLLSALNIVPMYERIRPILQTRPEVDQAKSDPGELTGEVEVNHVTFRYDEGGPLVLRDVSLHIRPGEFVALVGPSGSGKSTLLRLLLGFEAPESGAIYYDGQELAGLDIRAVRKQLGVVLQSGKLMAGDILTNIIGASLLTVDDAWEAARLAGLDKDIEQMPMGMYTVISEGGGTLSGGQRQRLLIARAIVTKPRIIFFDEATSALDNTTQAVVSQSLERLRATRVVIAHRLSTIIKADRVFVLEAGRVVQSGSYAELVKQPGLFADLVKRQLT
jgi:ATP-binding cassette subfamily C protein